MDCNEAQAQCYRGDDAYSVVVALFIQHVCTVSVAQQYETLTSYTCSSLPFFMPEVVFWKKGLIPTHPGHHLP